MDTVWLVEVSGTAIRAFVSRTRAEQFVQCMLEEELVPGERHYMPYEFEIVSLEIEK